MTAPVPGTPDSRDPRRERLIGLLALGIAVVLLVSSVTWFGTGQQGVGLGQLFLGVVLAVAGAALYRRLPRGGPRVAAPPPEQPTRPRPRAGAWGGGTPGP